MGLQNQLSDVSTESLLISAVVLLARGVGYLHSILLAILHGLGFFARGVGYPTADQSSSILYDVVGSGLAGLIVLCDQLSLNRTASEPAGPDADDCVVCLCPMAEGDTVRRLPCRHVFHRDCFGGWLHHHNFSCPLCRLPLVPDDCATLTRRRVAEDLLAWLPFQ